MGFPPWLSRKQTDYHLIVWWSRHCFDCGLVRDCLCIVWSRSVKNPESRCRTNKQTNGQQTQIIVWFFFYTVTGSVFTYRGGGMVKVSRKLCNGTVLSLPSGKKLSALWTTTKNSRDWTPIHTSTWFYENGHISANNGPILKIQNLAYSGLWARPVAPSNIGARDIARAMTSHARVRTSSWQQSLSIVWLPGTLLWAYLINRKVDFAHFLHANWYDWSHLTYKESACWTQYSSQERIFLFPWQPFEIFQFRFREVTLWAL